MSEYGVTPNGPNIKRLDTILDEMHEDLTEAWGVNTRQKPQSFINHLLTNVADQVAELWEHGEAIYYSQYVGTAEGTSLDAAAQYGGTIRETGKKSYYPIHCTGIDGTVLETGTMIASETNPKTYLTLATQTQITRSSFNKAVLKVASAAIGNVYTVMINGNAYSHTADSVTVANILNGIAAAMAASGFVTAVDENNGLLTIESPTLDTSHNMVLSESLTTESVTSVINFGTVDIGDILIPEKVINEIVKADAGLLKVTNLCAYTPGNDEETDAEFRKSYADKIFSRSSMMLESIRSAILKNVQGVVSVAPYENSSNEVDEYGRPPHSIEIVVDGGDAAQIAQQILQHKAGGISTFGSTVVNVAGLNGEDIPIRFNRPEIVYVWVHLGITFKKNDNVPANYVDLLKTAVLDNIGDLDAGEDVVPQEFMSDLYKACPGISYIDIQIASTADNAAEPTEYPLRSVEITARQRALTTESMIEVSIDG